MTETTKTTHEPGVREAADGRWVGTCSLDDYTPSEPLDDKETALRHARRHCTIKNQHRTKNPGSGRKRQHDRVVTFYTRKETIGQVDLVTEVAMQRFGPKIKRSTVLRVLVDIALADEHVQQNVIDWIAAERAAEAATAQAFGGDQ